MHKKFFGNEWASINKIEVGTIIGIIVVAVAIALIVAFG